MKPSFTAEDRKILAASGYQYSALHPQGPQACAGQPHQMTSAEIAAKWEVCKLEKKAQGVKQPAIACLPVIPGQTETQRRLAALDAATKRLEAVNAQARADRAKQLAKEAAATASASQTPLMDAFMKLSGAEATAFYRENAAALRSEDSAARARADHPGASITTDPKSGITTISQKIR